MYPIKNLDRRDYSTILIAKDEFGVFLIDFIYKNIYNKKTKSKFDEIYGPLFSEYEPEEKVSRTDQDYNSFMESLMMKPIKLKVHLSDINIKGVYEKELTNLSNNGYLDSHIKLYFVHSGVIDYISIEQSENNGEKIYNPTLSREVINSIYKKYNLTQLPAIKTVKINYPR